jgi:NAD-dependent deacetylase
VSISPSIVTRLRNSRRLLVLTGAGVSAESGIPTFRGTDGLWRKHRSEELATPEAFERDPKLVWEWYQYRRNLIAQAAPNAAHKAIVRLEDLFSDFLLVTQNVDGLHRRAGSKKIAELHGNIFREKCSRDGSIAEGTSNGDTPRRCQCGAYLRPDVVWFGEPLPHHVIELAFDFAGRCDAMMVVGTSGVVHPAASLPSIAKSHNTWVLEVNLEPTPITDLADESLFGQAGTILPHLEELLRG